MELYSSFMKLAPLLILKLFAAGRFGPSEQHWGTRGRVAFVGDVVLTVAVVIGGSIAILVLGDVLRPTGFTRGVLVVAGCLSLLVLSHFQARPDRRPVPGPSTRTRSRGHRGRGVRPPRGVLVTLYAAFLSMAPFILLAVTAGAFGPWSEDDDKEWSYAFLWDVVLVLSVITGGIVSLLVLGEVVGPSDVTQDFVVVAGCVSLALLAEHMLSTVRSRYRRHRKELTDDETPSQA